MEEENCIKRGVDMRQLSVCGVRGNEDFGGEKKRLPRQEGDWEINGQE